MFYVWYFWQTLAANDHWRKPAGLWWDIGVVLLVIRHPRRTWNYEREAMG